MYFKVALPRNKKSGLDQEEHDNGRDYDDSLVWGLRKIHPPPIFVNKALLEHSYLHSFLYCYFLSSMGEISCCNRDHTTRDT